MPGTSFTLLLGMAPAPPDVLGAVQEIQIETALEEASILRLQLSIAPTPTGDWSLLLEDYFRPLVPISVRLQQGTGLPQAIINGYAFSQQVVFGEATGTATLEVTGLDATLLMNLQEKSMAWPNLPDSAIATAIFGQYGLIPQPEPTSPTLVEPLGTTMQRATDIRFLRRLAERNGFFCYVQPEPVSGLDIGYFQPATLTGLPQAVLSVNMGEQTNCRDFRIRYEMLKPTTAITANIDPSTKAPQPGLAPVALETPMGLEPTLTRILPPPISRPTSTGLNQAGDLQKLAQALADRSSWAVTAEGQLDPGVAILQPGKPVNIRGVGRVYNGAYCVTRVQHNITPTGYTQRFEARRNAVTMTGAELFVEI